MPSSPPRESQKGSSSKRGPGAQLRAAPSPASGDRAPAAQGSGTDRAAAIISAAAAMAAGGSSVPPLPSSFLSVGAPPAAAESGAPTIPAPAVHPAVSQLPASGGAAVLTARAAFVAGDARGAASGGSGGDGRLGLTSADTVPRLVASASTQVERAMSADPSGSSQNPVRQDGRTPPPPSSKGRSGKKRKAKGKTPFAKRYQAHRPAGRHPGLKPWDYLAREVRSSLAGQERRIFFRTGLLVGRFDLQLYLALEESGSHLLGATYPRAPSWWPSDWGRVPIPLPLEVTLHRQQLVAAGDSSVWWKELYQLFLQQIAAGWDLEYTDPTKSQKHTLPPSIARAIVDHGGFSFLSTSSDTLAVFRSHHHTLRDEAIPVQQAANQAAWAGIAQARQLEAGFRYPNAGLSAPSLGIPPSQGWDVPSPIPSPLSGSSLQSALAASGLPGALREALAGEAELYVNTGEKCVAIASAAVRLAVKMHQARERMADLVRGPTRVVDPARLEAELTRELNAFPSLSRNLPRMFHAELGRIHDSQGSDAGPSQQMRYM